MPHLRDRRNSRAKASDPARVPLVHADMPVRENGQGDARFFSARFVLLTQAKDIRAERGQSKIAQPVISAQKDEVIGAPLFPKILSGPGGMLVGDVDHAERGGVFEQKAEQVSFLKDVPATVSIVVLLQSSLSPSTGRTQISPGGLELEYPLLAEYFVDHRLEVSTKGAPEVPGDDGCSDLPGE